MIDGHIVVKSVNRSLPRRRHCVLISSRLRSPTHQHNSMADQTDVFSTLDDFLLSLADGITSAQDVLTRGSALGPVGRQYTYHLPRVDFELKLNLRVVEDALLSQRYRPV